SERRLADARRPTRRASIFPYTTLFRSRAVVLTTERSGHTRDSPRGFTADKAATPRRPSSTRTPNRLTTYRDFSSHGARPRLTVLDRKSTRLNSSHLVISYAVFCLKKKY